MSLTEKNKVKKYIARIRKKNVKSNGVDTLKYCGTVKFDEDALVIQKKLRDEWQ